MKTKNNKTNNKEHKLELQLEDYSELAAPLIVPDSPRSPNNNITSSSSNNNRMYIRRKISKKCVFIWMSLISLSVILLFAFYRCPEALCNDAFSRISRKNESISSSSIKFDIPPNVVDYESMQTDNFEFHLNGSDVMVFLHIQKTGGTTFGKHLVQDIDLDIPCRCRKIKKDKKWRVKRKLKCDCFRPSSSSSSSYTTWLFSRYSTGWKCGLHPDWTELVACVDPYLRTHEGPAKRRYFYITFLREPLSRYLSEFRHVQRGATWRTALHVCNGRRPSPAELPPCYDEEDWSDVSLKEFMSCPSNLAINRMTRMLADLTLVNCYNVSSMPEAERDRIMLESAKNNLQAMAFFGLTEEQLISQYLFQETFNLKFKVKFDQFRQVQASATREMLDDSTIEAIRRLNRLDEELYQFAKELLLKRFEDAKREDENFEENFRKLGILPRSNIIPFDDSYY